MADHDYHEGLLRLALVTEMRRGDLLGLRLGQPRPRWRRFLGASNRLENGEPKTASGRRRIALPASVVESLRKHRARQLEYRLKARPAFEDRGLVFTSETGGPVHPNTLATRFRKLIVAASVPSIRFHDLRHTCAMLLLGQGVHPKVVQERLGHTDIAMTMYLYSHVTADMQRQAADQLDAVISGITKSA